jgi:hypothetical protein
VTADQFNDASRAGPAKADGAPDADGVRVPSAGSLNSEVGGTANVPSGAASASSRGKAGASDAVDLFRESDFRPSNERVDPHYLRQLAGKYRNDIYADCADEIERLNSRCQEMADKLIAIGIVIHRAADEPSAGYTCPQCNGTGRAFHRYHGTRAHADCDHCSRPISAHDQENRFACPIQPADKI